MHTEEDYQKLKEIKKKYDKLKSALKDVNVKEFIKNEEKVLVASKSDQSLLNMLKNKIN
mgnify:CR=1 FL=1